MKVINYNGIDYPEFQTTGFSAQFAFPFAKHFCNGVGYDIGCNRLEWAFPGAIPVDLNFNNGMDAYNLPHDVDYIFSSHCLEHLPDWVSALEYWNSKIKIGGVMFIYLPHYDQEYWRPWNNRKHLHVFTAKMIEDYLLSRGYKNVFCSGRDLNHSFMAVGQKT